jgi:hypothetical protein
MRNHRLTTARLVPAFSLIALWFLALAGQERVHEHIEVIYQEVLVRVFRGAEPVSGLTAGDFALYEDGMPVKVSYCRELRRSLASPEEEADAPRGGRARPRLFLFMLWFNEESREWPGAWEYFLENVYRPGDRIVLSDVTRAIEVSSPSRDREKIAAFFAAMTENLKQKKLDKSRMVHDLEKSAGDFFNDLVFLRGMPESDKTEKALLLNFKTDYLNALTEYRLKRLKGYPAWLERLAGALKAVEAEKWALVFLQNERLPLLHRDSRLFRDAPMTQATITELDQFMEDTEKQLKLASDVLSYLRDLRPLFVGANATYHVFLSDAAGEKLADENLQWQPVFSSWEGAFRQISADTGGRVSNTTKLDQALQRAAQSEDIYYVLTFKPGEGADRRRELKATVDRPGLRVVYSRRLTLGELFPLKIAAMDWRDGRLIVSLTDFQRIYGESGLAGRLRVSVQAEAGGGGTLAAQEEVMPGEAAVDVEMGLNFPAAGRYRLRVEVEDLLSHNRARAEKSIAVLPPEPRLSGAPVASPHLAAVLGQAGELDAVLEKTAGYCRRLKEAAFRFFCLEKTEETSLDRNPLTRQVESMKRRWECDYQITGAEGEIHERRRLVREGTRKVDREDARLETRFSSQYSVFLPVTLLAVENRGKYSYRLLEREVVKERSCAVVEVLPVDPVGGAIAQGKVWIDERDGSVRKICMSPRGVRGIQALEKAARDMSAELVMDVTHWYLVEHGGLCFPSRTEFIEQYRFDKSLANRSHIDVRGYHPSTTVMETRVRLVEFYRLRQSYEDYRFFEVQSREEIKSPE